jgi:hypothetical protein
MRVGRSIVASAACCAPVMSLLFERERERERDLYLLLGQAEFEAFPEDAPERRRIARVTDPRLNTLDITFCLQQQQQQQQRLI